MKKQSTTTRRVRRAVAAPVLIGAMACSVLGVPEAAAAAEQNTPAWLVSANAPGPKAGKKVHIVQGLTVRPTPLVKVLPVHGYRITATFGNAGSLWSSDHTGLDFAAPEGTALLAVGDAVVTEVGYDGAYGNKTVLELEDGTEVWYCHQSAQNVSVGQQVSAGDVIGAVGSTGNSTGPHLHLEVHVGGEPTDPAVALAGWGLKI
ncbi:M23 family metallopeptidase [Nocardioides stalactiti]|uniref:M23 family metallopeptidase n=1 Tax=Nocardioides stalactiti TaxID=2755356 RepID=UPI001C8099E0|nr:M23 family metallopeptidase [Nocardioides stalactiti]